MESIWFGTLTLVPALRGSRLEDASWSQLGFCVLSPRISPPEPTAV